MGWVRTHPCLSCASPFTEAHHLQRAQPRALGMKTGDEWTVPLCHSCHMELHRVGENKYWIVRGVDPYEWATQSHKEWRRNND